jgi:hypothetical protein
MAAYLKKLFRHNPLGARNPLSGLFMHQSLRGAIGGPDTGFQSLVQTGAGVAFGLGALIIATWIMRLIILHRKSHTQVIAKDKNISIATTAAALGRGQKPRHGFICNRYR